MSAMTLTTRLTKDECIRRLQRHTGRDHAWVRWEFVPWAEGTIAAKIKGDHFRLFAWGPANSHGWGFSPWFYGTLVQEAGCVRIRGHFRWPRISQGFLLVWFGGLAAMAAAVLLLPSSAWSTGHRPPMFAVLGGMALVILPLLIMLKLNERYCRGQVDSIRNFLLHELQVQAADLQEPKQPHKVAASP